MYSVPAVSFLSAAELSNVAVVPVTVFVSFIVVPSFTVTVYDVTAPLGAVQETASESTVAVTLRPVGAFGPVQKHHTYGISSNKT